MITLSVSRNSTQLKPCSKIPFYAGIDQTSIKRNQPIDLFLFVVLKYLGFDLYVDPPKKEIVFTPPTRNTKFKIPFIMK